LIDKRIIEALKSNLNIGYSTIYERIKKVRESRGFTISKEQAAALLAAENGIDISKFLKKEELSELSKFQAQQPVVIKRVESKGATPQPKVIQPASGIEIQDPLLPAKTANEAVEMSKIYVYIYIFENSVRNVISLVLSKKYGTNWRETRVTGGVKKNVQGRINDEINNPWHGKRGSAPIFYTLIDDLKSIIKNNWGDFASLFPDQTWIDTRIGEIERSRNIIAHNNPHAKRDIDRIKLYFEDWEEQVKTIKNKI